MRHQLFKSGFMVMAVLALAGCAQQTSTRATSFVDPAYQGMAFSALAVEAEAGLQEREIIERSVGRHLNQAGVNALVSLDVLPPTRDYAQAVRKRKMAATGMPALLVMTPADKRMIEDYIPPSYSSGPYGPGFSPYGGYGRYGGRNHFGVGAGMNFGRYYDPGVILREPQSDYIASLYLLPGFEKIWTAEFSVRGANGMDFNGVAARFAEIIVRRMQADGLIP